MKYTLTPKSRKGQNRIAAIRDLHPSWDGTWFARAVHSDQIFAHPNVPEPERFSRWVELQGDPNFTVLPVVD